MFLKKIFAYLVWFLSVPILAFAQNTNPTPQYPNEGACDGKICNPLTASGQGTITIEEIAGKIILYLLGISGTIALIMFIYGGIQWMTSAGSSDKIKKGKDTMLWAALGLVIIFSSWAVIRSVLELISF